MLYLDSSFHCKMDLISVMVGFVFIIGNPKVAYFSINFSETETFHKRILSSQSSFKEGFHFSHVRGTPL